jgi:hypothetical protein
VLLHSQATDVYSNLSPCNRQCLTALSTGMSEPSEGSVGLSESPEFLAKLCSALIDDVRKAIDSADEVDHNSRQHQYAAPAQCLAAGPAPHHQREAMGAGSTTEHSVLRSDSLAACRPGREPTLQQRLTSGSPATGRPGAIAATQSTPSSQLDDVAVAECIFSVPQLAATRPQGVHRPASLPKPAAVKQGATKQAHSIPTASGRIRPAQQVTCLCNVGSSCCACTENAQYRCVQCSCSKLAAIRKWIICHSCRSGIWSWLHGSRWGLQMMLGLPFAHACRFRSGWLGEQGRIPFLVCFQTALYCTCGFLCSLQHLFSSAFAGH